MLANFDKDLRKHSSYYTRESNEDAVSAARSKEMMGILVSIWVKNGITRAPVKRDDTWVNG
jgi:hypothetical protein